jgi:S1-C subfamily serine protease
MHHFAFRSAVACGAVLLSLPAFGQSAGEATDIIWCHDPARSIVAQKSRWKCAGQAVSAKQAEDIRNQRERLIQRKMKADKPLVPGRALRGSGTGFFVTRAGHVLTNNHVIDGCAAVSVAPPYSRGFVSTVIDADAGTDLALLQSPLNPKAFAAFRSPLRLKPAEAVAVMGYPEFGRIVIRPVMTTGHIHVGTGPWLPRRFAMAIKVRRGNSGGPVLDGAGLVIGVVNSKINTPGLYKRTGKVVDNLGFAIRQRDVLAFMAKNGVGATLKKPEKTIKQVDLKKIAEQFVVRIGCWK